MRQLSCALLPASFTREGSLTSRPKQIVELLVASLTLDGTPVPRKIARLHLVSDILHNSSASLPNAWVYRSILEGRLPVVFDHLGDVYRSFPGRMKAEQFAIQVTNVRSVGLARRRQAKLTVRLRPRPQQIIDVWERDWILFEPTIIEDFRQRLSGLGPALVAAAAEAAQEDIEMAAPAHSYSSAPLEPEAASVSIPAPEAEPSPPKPKAGFKTGGFKTTFQPSALHAVLPDEEGDVDGAPVEEEDVDGEAFDVDGEAVDVDVDGEAVDVDGEALDAEPAPKAVETVVIEDDGEAMDVAQSDEDIF